MSKLEVRFWSKVQREGSTECWLWTGAKTGGSPGLTYGAFCFNSSYVPAHRFSYSLHYGLIPKGQVVMHTCDNPMCVNPKHLKLGSQKDNIRDAVRKGRWMSDKRRAYLDRAKSLPRDPDGKFRPADS